MRKIGWILLLVLSVLLLAGVAQAAQPVQVTLMWWLDDSRGEEYTNNMAIIKKFEELYPNIKVNLVFADWSVITDKIKIMAAAGQSPDLVWLRGEHYWDLGTGGFLRDLRPFMEKDPKWNPANLLPGVLESTYIGGVPYALHRDVYPNTIHYNADRFAEGGIAAPRVGWTYDELLAISKKLTDPLKSKFGMGNIQSNRDAIILSYGGRFTNAEQTELMYHEAPAMAAIEYMRAFKLDHHAQPIGSELADWWEPQWTRGDVAMQYWGPWAWATYIQTIKFKWDVAPPAAGPAGARTTLDGMMIGMSNQTKVPEEAWTLLRFLTYEEPAQTLQVQLGIASPTVRYSKTLQAYYETSLRPPTIANYILNLTAGNPAIPRLPQRVNDLINTMFDNIMNGVVDPRSAVTDTERRAAAMLAEDYARVKK